MESLAGLDIFVRVGELRSFTAASQQLGISSSAVSKSISRLEQRLGVRLFHRSTRSMTLTAEGNLFLERCRRILCEINAAEVELSQSQRMPQGRLKISVPALGLPFMTVLANFERYYPDIQLEIDCSDRMVDVVEEGFDAVIRIGTHNDSSLMMKKVGQYRQVVVASPEYLHTHGTPQQPEDLEKHRILFYRIPSSGKVMTWPLYRDGQRIELNLNASMVVNTLEPQICFAEHGIGIACIPDISVREHLRTGRLVHILESYNQGCMAFSVLWPSSRYLSPKLRVFIDFMQKHLSPL
ncbi:LysR family transcriptional regulator [Acinetobacter calcoaceticus]|uniref:LysR family transcriptional regulator n=1 Tax=Acinetobacter calcoaceticus TaxID=471 RepID=A0A4R1YA74_ACICA|nr:LysR family transcriptional regulator [Acinetobacter calcoaceticus]